MGTSGRSGGTLSSTSLVPTFVDDAPAGPLPGAPPAEGAESDQADDADGNQVPPAPRPAIQPPPALYRFQEARRNFNGFVRGGGDGGALRRGVSKYVRSGTRGSGNATRRMGASRAAASNVLGVLRGIQRDGVDETLRRLNLTRLIGRSVEDMFIGLTDVVCRDGGSIDEAIARDAWLETVAELEALNIADINAVTADQVRAVFEAFVAHAIVMRLWQDIGAKGLELGASLDSIESFQAGLLSYIRRSVRDSFSADLSALSDVSDDRIREITDQTYREAWDLLDAWGDTAP